MGNRRLDLPLPKNQGFWISCGLTLCLFLAVSQMKVAYSSSMRPYDPKSETGYYWSESALQYRYARQVALGQTIPDVDVAAESPEGVTTATELTLLMERTTGMAYRLFARFHQMPVHAFVLYFYSLFSSLAILAFFLAAWHATRSAPLSFLATIAYAMAPGSWARYIGSFVYEGFALPLLFFGIAGILGALRHSQEDGRRRAWAWACGGAVCVAVGLGGWHFSRFFFLVVTAILGLFAFVSYRDRRAESALTAIFVALAVTTTVSGCLFTVLRENGFLMSPPFVMLWALAGGQLLRSKYDLSRSTWLVAVFGATIFFLLVAQVGGGHEGAAYGHVYSLFIAKVTHLLQKPSDPAELSTAARILWVDPFNSPALGNIFYYFFPLALPILVAAGAGLVRLSHPSRADVDSSATVLFFLAALFLSWFGLYLLIARLMGIAVFFGALLAAHVVAGRWKNRALALTVCFVLAGAESAKALTTNSRLNVLFRIAELLTFSAKEALGQDSNIKGVLGWISANTATDERFLAGIGMSPLVLAYGQRPIVLQPKFESARTRAAYVDYLRALFGKEEDAYRYCIATGADYLIHQASTVTDDTTDGDLYTSGGLDLPADSAAFKFQFSPSELRRFQLVYQNSDFRVFRVLRDGSSKIDTAFRPFRQAVYSLSEFPPGAGGGLRHGDAKALTGKLILRKRGIQVAEAKRNAGDPAGAEAEFEKVLALFPDDAATWLEVGRLRYKTGDAGGAEKAFRTAVRTNPNDVAAHEFLADVLLARGDFAGAQPVLQRAVELDPRNAGTLNNLGAAFARTGALAKSLEAFRKARSLAPADAEIARNFERVERALRHSGSR